MDFIDLVFYLSVVFILSEYSERDPIFPKTDENITKPLAKYMKQTILPCKLINNGTIDLHNKYICHR